MMMVHGLSGLQWEMSTSGQKAGVSIRDERRMERILLYTTRVS